MYNNVLLAIDLGKDTKKIAQKARAITAEKGTFHVIHVVEPLDTLYAGEAFASTAIQLKQIQDEVVNSSSKQLNELAATLGINNDQVNLVIGHPATEIKHYAKEHNIDVIVMGCHGKHGLQLLLGSTSNAVLHGVCCDVLAVKVDE